MRLVLCEVPVIIKYDPHGDQLILHWYAGLTRIEHGYRLEPSNWHSLRVRAPDGTLVVYRAK